MADNHHFAILSVLTVVLLVGIGGLFLATPRGGGDTVVYREYPVITGMLTKPTSSDFTTVSGELFGTVSPPITEGDLTTGENDIITLTETSSGTQCIGDFEACNFNSGGTGLTLENKGTADFNIDVNSDPSVWGGSAVYKLRCQSGTVPAGATCNVNTFSSITTIDTTVATDISPGNSITFDREWDIVVAELTDGATVQQTTSFTVNTGFVV